MLASERETGRRYRTGYGLFAVAFVFLVLVAAVLSQFGLADSAIALIVVLVTFIACAVLGVAGGSLGEGDFFAGGRNIPAAANGLAAAAGFLSIGGFAGLAGLWFADPDGALALGLGWVTGFLVLAVAIAPYFRKSGAVTLPDFLAIRYGGRLVRALGLGILVLVTFAVLAALIAAAASIAGLFVGMSRGFAIGAAVVLVLFSALFGGMRAAILVAGAEAVVFLIALLVPGAALSAREYGLPLPQLTYGFALEEIGPNAGTLETIAGNFLRVPFTGGFNLFALALTVGAGTAALPQLVMMSAATQTAAGARRAAAWGMLVVVLAVITAPAIAAFARLGIFREVVGAQAGSLPDWVSAYGRAGLVRICGFDASSAEAFRAACAAIIGPDGLLRPGDIAVSRDIIGPAFADISDLPYVMTALLAAGGLAAALAGATLVAIGLANSIGHDFYGHLTSPKAPAGRRLILTRVALVVVTIVAGLLAMHAPGRAVDFATFAPTLAAAGLFPALILGIWWRRANAAGAIAGMAAGFGITLFYIAVFLLTGAPPTGFPDFGAAVPPVAAAIYGLPIGLLVTIGVSLASAAPAAAPLDSLRQPERDNPAADEIS